MTVAPVTRTRSVKDALSGAERAVMLRRWVRCGVLGELVVVDGLRTVRVGRSTRAVVPAALVCRVGSRVAVEELVDLVWVTARRRRPRRWCTARSLASGVS